MGSRSEFEADVAVNGVRLRLMGRAVFLALRYNPHALQIVDPVGDLRHRGVLEVPQLLMIKFSFVSTANWMLKKPWMAQDVFSPADLAHGGCVR